MKSIVLKKQRVLVFILTVLIVIGSVGGATFDSKAESFVNINVGGSATVKASGRLDWSAYIRFIAPEDGFYSFYSDTESDTYGYLYNEEFNEIKDNDDGEKNYNFNIISYLKKGSVSYIGAGWYDEDSVIGDGSITVYCEKIDTYSLSVYDCNPVDIYINNGKRLNNPTVRFYFDDVLVSDVRYSVKFYNGSEYVDTIPDTPGEYDICIEGVAPYTDFLYKEVELVNVTFDDVQLATSMYEYNGSPIPVSEFKLGFGGGGFYKSYGSVSDNALDVQLTLGKDYKYDGYLRYDNYFVYDTSYISDQIIKWRSGTPTETGTYYLKFTGIGEFSGTKIIPIYITKELPTDDLNSTEIKNSSASLKINNKFKAFELKPNETDTYTISGIYSNDGVPIYCVIFDEYGRYIKEVQSNIVRKSIECKIDMEKGKSYYLLLIADAGDKAELDLSLSIKGNTKNYTWYTPVQPAPEKKALEKGKTFIIGKLTYKVTKSDGNNSEVSLVKNSNKKIKNVKIAASVKYDGFTYKVTAIGANAFKNNKKLTKATIGSNVKTIGKNAFSGDKKLKTVTIKTKGLKKIGKYAFKSINKKAVIKTPKAKKKTYTKLLKKSKLAKTVKIK